ncbi:MAG: hypothetical protein HQM06_13395 [Magnetococcales bacterium]|nr:hypothetical protein [Magnetococcales bacterium]
MSKQKKWVIVPVGKKSFHLGEAGNGAIYEIRCIYLSNTDPLVLEDMALIQSSHDILAERDLLQDKMEAAKKELEDALPFLREAMSDIDNLDLPTNQTINFAIETESAIKSAMDKMK